MHIDLPDNIGICLKSLKLQFNKKRKLLDCNSNSLSDALKEIINLNIIYSDISPQYGKITLDVRQQYYYYREITRLSGALCFLLMQYYTATSFIANSQNHKLKEELLRNNSNRNYLCGISHAHLRNIESPPVVGVDNGDKYTINGILSYVTGYKIFNKLLLGFVSGNKKVFALIPFEESKSFSILGKLDLVAVNSTNTVTCQLINYQIDKSMIVAEELIDSLANRGSRTGKNIIGPHIGLALAVLDLITDHKYLEIDIVRDTRNFLIKEILNYENQLFIPKLIEEA